LPRTPRAHYFADRAADEPANRRISSVPFVIALLLILVGRTDWAAAENTEIKIGYLAAPEQKLTISLLDMPADNNGIAGARVAVDDNNTTGKFLNQKFSLEETKISDKDDPAAAVDALAAKGINLVISDLPADGLLKAVDAGRAHGMLFFNVGATDDRLRESDCRPNVIHVAPTRSMLADGLAQYLVWKRWRKWLLVLGSHPKDQLWAEALRHAASRFGAKIVAERVFEDTGGARQTDSGLVQIQRQIPTFTQDAPDYDVLVAADESEVFAGYLPYRTWDARPVAGSAGLVPTAWDPSFEQWGAAQMQNRFMKLFSRRMDALDMQSWAAARMIGEAATRIRSADPAAIHDYITGPNFALAAFKGQKLTVRDWNQQLRQPILLSDGRNIASVSPQEGFLHQVSELDTLGYDRPETKCKFK
jgi:ABC transporter substrate binding protein (PQQ-dependent alcohol dehydrogenase system)